MVLIRRDNFIEVKMINKEMFTSKKGKIINVITVGSGAALSGTVVDCSDDFLTLSTRWSSKQYVAIEKIQSFWCNDDKPNDDDDE